MYLNPAHLRVIHQNLGHLDRMLEQSTVVADVDQALAATGVELIEVDLLAGA